MDNGYTIGRRFDQYNTLKMTLRFRPSMRTFAATTTLQQRGRLMDVRGGTAQLNIRSHRHTVGPQIQHLQKRVWIQPRKK